jgi:glycosyltransferase involved in cell wall biosynthesis
MKFLIITPVFNGERFIAEAIESVLSQEGEFEIEYRVLDGGSNDRTVEIIRLYAEAIERGSRTIRCAKVTMFYSSQKDAGMYSAINRGFSEGVGDVLAWINADDVYLPGAFAAMANVFGRHPEVSWVKGVTSYIDEASKVRERGRCFLYDQEWLKRGVYGTGAYFVQQDSVFWRYSLWKKHGPILNSLQLAGDYFLWTRFALSAPLISVDFPVSCFRKVKGQLSESSARYHAECKKVLPGDTILGLKFRIFRKIELFSPIFFRRWLFMLIFPKLKFEVVVDTEIRHHPYYLFTD